MQSRSRVANPTGRGAGLSATPSRLANIHPPKEKGTGSPNINPACCDPRITDRPGALYRVRLFRYMNESFDRSSGRRYEATAGLTASTGESAAIFSNALLIVSCG